MAQFQEALAKLVEDPDYREAVIKDPNRLTNDFKQLDPRELLLLMHVWHATGHPEAASSIIRLCHCCCCGRPKKA